MLPSLTKHIAVNNINKINSIQNKSFELSLFLSLPAMLSLLVASEQITSSLFGYGSFDLNSVKNSSKALFYFAFGLPAFALIKIFSSFLFARQNTKVPFYFSIVSVIINIFISVTFFNKIGFIIIPIATTISSWVNTTLLFFFLGYKNYFSLNKDLFFSFFKILCASTLSTCLFYLFIVNFPYLFSYDTDYKLLWIIITVIIVIFIYIFISILTKAFKLSDIKLKY